LFGYVNHAFISIRSNLLLWTSTPMWQNASLFTSSEN
jgi:hypothetical protein